MGSFDWTSKASADHRPDVPEPDARFRKALLGEIGFPFGGFVLDFGCGYGRMASVFEPEFYIGVDVNADCLAEARRRYPEHRFEIVNPKQTLQKVDVVLAWTVMLHIPDEDLEATCLQLRAAAPKIVIVEDMESARRAEPPYHHRAAGDYAQAFAPCQVFRCVRFREPDCQMLVLARWPLCPYCMSRDVRPGRFMPPDVKDGDPYSCMRCKGSWIELQYRRQ